MGIPFMIQPNQGGFCSLVCLESGVFMVFNGVTGKPCSRSKGAYFYAKRFIKDALDNKLALVKPVYWEAVR